MVRRIILAFVAFLISTTPSTSQHAEVTREDRYSAYRRYRSDIEDNLSLIAAALSSGMSKSERAILRQIDFRISNRFELVRARAHLLDGRRVVELGAGFLTYLMLYCEAAELENTGKFPEFGDNYISYAIHGGAFRPTQVAGLSPKEEAAFYDVSGQERFRYTIFHQALAFIAAHEVAHHKYGDVEKPPKDLEESRKREARADEWASRVLLRTLEGYSSLGGVYAALYLRQFDRFFLRTEGERSHALPAKRALEALRSIEPEIGRLVHSADQTSDVARVRSQLRAAIQALADIALEDSRKNREWYLRAEERGDREAMVDLAYWFLKGKEGFPIDRTQALELYEKAALMGHVDAQARAGLIWAYERKDLEKARFWLRKSAAEGSILARVNLDALDIDVKRQTDEYRNLKELDSYDRPDFPLEVKKKRIFWSTDNPKHPVVVYAYDVANRSDRTVECSLLVRTVNRDRKSGVVRRSQRGRVLNRILRSEQEITVFGQLMFLKPKLPPHGTITSLDFQSKCR
jgi:TPR repeat protein